MLIFYLTPKEGESAVKRTFALRGHGSAPNDPTNVHVSEPQGRM